VKQITPLRKKNLDGSSYFRRKVVEIEIKELAAQTFAELERRSSLWPSSVPGYVSSEALVYFVRNLQDERCRDKLTQTLLKRIMYLLRRANAVGGRTESLTNLNIREEVIDHFVDLLLSDRGMYDDRLDYYEINFNSAIRKDRLDASARHWKHENRNDELDSEDVHNHTISDTAGCYNPFDIDEFDEKSYRLCLQESIDSLPEFQRRIIEMWRQEIPIESKDPSLPSISKILGKTEKTIRTHRDKAFASLRLRLEREGKKYG
jgi:hypothetical protein